jgi:tRNA A-37 threonylcarbamoyl transferase component Bud32
LDHGHTIAFLSEETMTKLTATQILRQVNGEYPRPSDPQFRLRSEHSAKVSTTLGLIEQLDQRELRKLSEEERASYLMALTEMRSAVDGWKNTSAAERRVGHDTALGPSPALHNQNAIEVVKMTLEKLVSRSDLATEENPPAAKPKKATFGERWHSERSLSEGGQGQTFVVTDTTGQLPGEYVLKRLKNKNRKVHFDREVAACLALDHPHIIKIVDSDLDADKPFFVTAYRRRGHLDAAHLAGKTVAEKLRTFAQVADAFAYAHSKDVIHRDIKPDNILVRDDGSLEMADFGLCYIQDVDNEDERATKTLEVHRNWLCVAPELEAGRADTPSPASDVYCLGKLLYWMLTGVAVPRERHHESVFDLARREPKGAHALVNEWLDKVLVSDPAKRLENGGALVEALGELTRRVEMNAHVVDLSAPQLCAYCGIGLYEVHADPRWWDDSERNLGRIRDALTKHGIHGAMNPAWLILRCDHCGHQQTFRPQPGKWNPPQR